MKYLIQTKTKFANDNFLFTEDQAKRFLKLACEQKDVPISLSVFELRFGKPKQLFVRFSNDGQGGYVEDWYDNLEFNF